MRISSLFPTFAVSLAGCLAQPAPRSLHNLAIEVAPLELQGIDFACYDVLVRNGHSETVVALGEPSISLLSQPSDAATLCSTQYGNGPGGGLSYVAPCDAARPAHTVTLWVDGLYRGTREAPTGVEYQDPCGDGCELAVACAENADTPVIFNLTIMRPAIQGFFDIAVNFDDIFCSAKFDTCYAGGEHIELLHGADGARDWTGVFAFACSAGAGDADTILAYSELAVLCDDSADFLSPDHRFPIDPALLAGNQVSTDSVAGEATLDYAIYRGSESLACDDVATQEIERCNKRYWNLAFNLMDLQGLGESGCKLAFSATATDGNEGFSAGVPTQSGVSYPYIDVDVVLAPATCQRNGLNDGGGVTTTYHGTVGEMSGPPTMCSEFDGESAGPVAGALCGSTTVICPCWERAQVVAQIAAIKGVGLGNYAVDHEEYAEPDYSAAKLDLEAFVSPYYELSVRVEDESPGGRDCSYEYYSDPPDEWIELDHDELSEAEYAACAADMAVFKDDPCAVDNGGCVGATPACMYEGPGQRRCVECMMHGHCAGNVAAPFCDRGANVCSESVVCPCWNRAMVSDQFAMIQIVVGDELETDYSVYSSPDSTSVDLSLEASVSPYYEVYLGAASELEDGDSCYYEYYSDPPDLWVETAFDDLSSEEYAACSADLGGFADDPCAQGNGGCGGSTPGCLYAGPGANTCVECVTSADCAGHAGAPACDPGENRCVECLSDAQCDTGEICDGQDQRCVPDPCLPSGQTFPAVRQVVGSSWASLALRADGTVHAWGEGTIVTLLPPDLDDVVYIAAALYMGAAVRADGTVVTWGDDYGSGALTVPAGAVGVAEVSCGSHSGQPWCLALKSDGSVIGWGLNNHGQTDVPLGLTNVVAIASGGEHNLALRSDGTVVAWGGQNTSGELNVPSGLMNAVAINAGIGHSVAALQDGTVVAWGQAIVTPPGGLAGVATLARGFSGSHVIALKDDGGVVAWGSNQVGQTSVPCLLDNIGSSAVGTGAYHSLAVTTDGQVVAWGWNAHGQTAVPAFLGGP